MMSIGESPRRLRADVLWQRDGLAVTWLALLLLGRVVCRMNAVTHSVSVIELG